MKNSIYKFLFIILIVFGLLPEAGAQFPKSEPPNESPLTARARFQPSTLEPGATADLLVDLELAAGYHAYLDKFKLTIESPDDLKLAPFKISPIVKFNDVISKSMKDGVKDKSQMKALMEVPVGFRTGSHVAKLKLIYQACTDEFCLFPKTIELNAPFEVKGDAKPLNRIENAQKKVEGDPLFDSPAARFQQALSQGLLPALTLMFIVGFLTSLTPCVYPMIPITLTVLGARGKHQSHMRSFALALVYVLGIAFTYSLLGVLAASTGMLFGAALGNVWVVTGIALIFLAMGLSEFGLFEMQAPAFVRDRLGAAHPSKGFVGAFATGLIAGIVASPCIGPVLVAVLTYIAKTQDKTLGFLLLFTFAMGMGTLFIALGLSSSLVRRIPKAGPWMDVVRYLFGLVMIGMAFYYIQPVYPKWLISILGGLIAISLASVYGAFHSNEGLSQWGRVRKGLMFTIFVVGVGFVTTGALTGAGLLPDPAPLARKDASAASESYPKLAWQDYSNEKLDSALKAGRPVIIDFTAEWCAACKELERYTFTDSEVRALSSKFALFKVDATEDSPALGELKKRFEVVGLPTLIFYDAKGKKRDDLTVTGFEKADIFLRRMRVAAGDL